MRPKRPIVVSVNRVYDGNRISVRVETARFDGGSEFDRDIVEYPGSVVLVPIKTDGTVLLIRQFRQAAESFLLEAPAGTLEPGENPVETAHRELREEVGYRAGKLIPIGGSWVAPGYSTEYSHMFIATELKHDPLPADDGEDIVIDEFEFADIHRLISTGQLEDQISIAAVLSAQHIYVEQVANSMIEQTND